MRFMIIMYPENYPTAKAGWVPDLTDIEDTRKFHEEMGAAGVLVALDGLTPPATMSARITLKNGKLKVTDGPFTEAKEVIGGYYVIEVKSREEAIKWASRIPQKDGEMVVEVRRFFDMSDFAPPVQDRLSELEEEQAAKGIKQPGRQ
ncbi:MAG: YciI family protein [Candidatus Acidiferrales bacterium]